MLEFMDRKSVFRLFTNIFWEIITFAKNLINTEIQNLYDIKTYIENKIDSFSDHISSTRTSIVLKNEERGIDGDRDVYIFPIMDLMLGEYIKLGKLLIIPTGFLNECSHEREKYLGLSDFFIDRMLVDNLIEHNNVAAFV